MTESCKIINFYDISAKKSGREVLIHITGKLAQTLDSHCVVVIGLRQDGYYCYQSSSSDKDGLAVMCQSGFLNGIEGCTFPTHNNAKQFCSFTDNFVSMKIMRDEANRLKEMQNYIGVSVLAFFDRKSWLFGKKKGLVLESHIVLSREMLIDTICNGIAIANKNLAEKK